MKLIRSTTPLSKQFRPTAIVLAVATLMMPSVMSQAGTTYKGDTPSYNKLGDLTIYQPSTQSNKPTLTLMLDKSGSMRGDYSFSRDIPNLPNLSKRQLYRVCSTNNGRSCERNPSYEYYLAEPNNRDIPNGYKKDNWDSSKYTYGNLKNTSNKPCMVYDYYYGYSLIKYDPDITTITRNRNGIDLESCEFNNETYYDRMSKLKLAMIELLDFESVNEDIIMGVGAFGYSSYKGQIKVAAKPLDASQKQKIYAFLKDLSPSGGTPMSTAYTEAGAYMLGSSSYRGYYKDSYSSMYTTGDSSIAKNGQYIAPETQECGAKGVYLLTDGFPNAITAQDTLTDMMASALDVTRFSCPSSDGLLDGTETDNYRRQTGQWKCMGEFAKQLRTSKQVRTAMVGFGSDFNTVDNPSNYTSKEIIINKFKDNNGVAYKYNKKYYDCSKISINNPDARNACNLGMESGVYPDVGGYGQGGFYFAKDTKDIVGSVLSVIEDLKSDLPSVPAGTITVPADPLNSLGVKPYAYLPMLEPKVGSDLSIWPGNLKKYHVKQGTLYGQNNKRLYIDDQNKGGFPDDLNPAAQDIWSTKNETILDATGTTVEVNNRITAGGFYAQLKTPKKADNTTRNVYVENTVSGKTTLLKIGVNAGKLEGFDTLDSSYTTLMKLYLLNFLGYDANPSETEATRIGTNPTKVKTELEKIIATPPGDIKVLGGVIHSRPTLITYGANINATNKDSDGDGKIDADAGMVATDESSRDDYVMFGSMEGALHIASAETGQESLAFIPKTILNKQLEALQPASTIAHAPAFGVDAPWSVQGSYKYDYSAPNAKSSGKIIAEQVYIYGGLGKGGQGLYGLDVSKLGSPKMLFSLNATGDYKALGKVWSEPVTGRIRTGTDKDSIKDVIVFGGGYDECYEDPTFRLGSTGNAFSECDAKNMADGNAVYIADAKTGAVLWSISGRDSGASGKHIKVPEMKHSVVGKITTLDRDDDGLIDHLYFADLGGQVFRVDLRNGQSITGSTGTNNFTRRIVRIFNASGDDKSDANSKTLLAKGLQLRFYGQPSVSFYKDKGVLFALVNIASGDRSNPISRLRNTIPAQSDRLFGIIDRDVASPSLYAKDDVISLTTKDLTSDKLTELPFNRVSGATKAGVQAPMRPNAATKQGWFYPLNLFDGYNKVKNVKSMGDGLALGGLYYMTAYSPEMKYDETSGCAAQIVGGSERQMYCLPYGICEQEDPKKADTSLNGTGGFVRAGKGIQELAFGAFDAKDPTTRIMLGPQSFSEIINSDNRIGFGAGAKEGTSGLDVNNCLGGNCGLSSSIDKTNASGSGGGNVSSMNYKLFTTRWYEQLTESTND